MKPINLFIRYGCYGVRWESRTVFLLLVLAFKVFHGSLWLLGMMFHGILRF